MKHTRSVHAICVVGFTDTKIDDAIESMETPWKRLVLSILQKSKSSAGKDAYNMQLATFSLNRDRPCNRTVVFRGFVGEKTGAESPLIVVTTDTMMAKAAEIENYGSAGAPYEVCWWHSATSQQIRFHGRAWLVTQATTLSGKLPATSRVTSTENQNWSWEIEWNSQWKSLSPTMRGTFRNPSPGMALESNEQKQKLSVVKMETGDEALENGEGDEARSRFSLVVLQVEEIEILDLDPPPGSRTRWKLIDGKDWRKQDLCP